MGRYVTRSGDEVECDGLTLTVRLSDASKEEIKEKVLDEVRGVADENAELRSRIAALVKILRDEWDIDASWDGLRKFWYVVGPPAPAGVRATHAGGTGTGGNDVATGRCD